MTTVIIILGCLLLSFFFSGMETGVLLLNRARVRHLKENGSVGARILLDFLHSPGRLSSTVLVGNTIVNTIATILVAQSAFEIGGPLAAAAAVLLFSLILWIYGELVPKTLFRRYPNRLASSLAPALLLAYIALWPMVQLFNLLSQAIIRAMGGKVSSRQMFVTRDELKLLAREGEDSVSLTGEQRNLVASILDSSKATARDMMRLKSKVITVKETFSEKERLSISAKTSFSRFPIETRDSGDHWSGLWVAYDSLFWTNVQLRTPPIFKAGTRPEEILLSLRKARSPFGFVKNPDGQHIGIITVEDVLRKYLGKIDL